MEVSCRVCSSVRLRLVFISATDMDESAAAVGRAVCPAEVRVRLRVRAPATAPQRKTRIREKNATRSAGRGSVMLDMLALFPVTRQSHQHDVAVRARGMIGRGIVL